MTNSSQKFIYLYAPNVHTGGGLQLLEVILLEWQPTILLKVFLDYRIKDRLYIDNRIKIVWVKPTVVDRIKAEICLSVESKNAATVLCFHGLPPIFRNNSKVVVFFQNVNLFYSFFYILMKNRYTLRTLFEKIIFSMFKYRVDEFIVQTSTTYKKLNNYINGFHPHLNKKKSIISIFPFIRFQNIYSEISSDDTLKKWDFIYIADGASHKNHSRLFEAWVSLSKKGIRPTLALTLGSRDALLIESMESLAKEYTLNIFNLGYLLNNELMLQLRASRALIYPSLGESFGLPLIEASLLGIPIIASELDFTWDVCSPVTTFDPSSSRSIERAVLRFLKINEPLIKLNSGDQFWKSLGVKFE